MADRKMSFEEASDHIYPSADEFKQFGGDKEKLREFLKRRQEETGWSIDELIEESKERIRVRNSVKL